MTENLNKPQSKPIKERKTMDIYNFEQTSTIPPVPGEPLRRDGYKWIEKDGQWNIDISQSQTKRFGIMLEQNPSDKSICSFLSKERQLDGFEQVLKTPPKPNEPTIKFRDYNGVNGTEVVWSQTSKRWEFTGLCLQNIPPIKGSLVTKKDLYGNDYVWSQEKNRWIRDITIYQSDNDDKSSLELSRMVIRNNIRDKDGNIIPPSIEEMEEINRFLKNYKNTE